MAVAAIFDIDGTLVTFQFDVQGTRKAILEELSARGFDTAGLSLTSSTQKILDEAKMQAAGKEETYEAFRKKAFSILDSFELRAAGLTSVFPETRASLDHLRSRGVRLAVLTNSGRKAATSVLRRAVLLDFFEFVLTRDDTETMKPRPEGLVLALSMIKMPAENVYYVGDGLYDITAAKLAGINMVSVTTRYPEERLRAGGADYVIPSISRLGPILGV